MVIGNTSIGGTLTDCIHEVYLDNAEAVEEVVCAAGSDAVGTDPTRLDTVEFACEIGGGTREANVVLGPWTYIYFMAGEL